MNDNERWNAISERNADCDGKFWFGVMTTGVYCKPSCPGGRRVKRENVRLYATIAAARRDGLRACKRCRPDSADGATLASLLDICAHIENHPTDTHSLAGLSRRAAISQFQLQRLFKAFLQLTPKEYIEQVRMRALKMKLRGSQSVTDAIFDAGFESSSAVYGRMDAHLGMTPKKYREGGKGVDISFAFGATALGKVLIGATDRGICYLQFGDSERELLAQLAAEYPNATVQPSNADRRQFEGWMTALNTQLQKQTKTSASALHKLPLDVRGTAFQKRVWEFLRTIPSGDVVSYAEVAGGIGAPKAVRAAASACANNRIGVLIPCHRVIRGTGELGGYRWGLARKRALLDLERKNKKSD